MKHKTRLSYLLSRVGMRSIDLAAQTGIDKTVISRWRGGRRRFPAAGAYAEKVTACILAYPGALSTVERMLLAGGYAEGEGSLEQRLALWLSEESLDLPVSTAPRARADANQYTTMFTQFWGQKGLRRGMITFLEFADSLHVRGEGMDIQVAMWGDNEWFAKYPDFQDELFVALEDMFGRGGRMTIAHPDKFLPGDLSAHAADWLAAHLRGHIVTLDLPVSRLDFEEDSFLYASAKNVVGLWAFSMLHLEDGVGGSIFTDEIATRRIQQRCEELFAVSTPRYRTDFFSFPGETPVKEMGAKQLEHGCFVYTPVPFLGTVPFGQMHTYAKMPQKSSLPVLGQIRPLTHTPEEYAERAIVRHVFCAEEVEACLFGRRYRNRELSVLLDGAVALSPRQMAEQLQRILGWLDALKGYEVAFVPKEVYEKQPLSLYMVEKCFLAAWLPDASHSLFTQRKNRVGAMWSYDERVWEAIPVAYRSGDKVKKQIEEWLARFGAMDAKE